MGTDRDMKMLRDMVYYGFPDDPEAMPGNIIDFHPHHVELAVCDGFLVYGGCVVIPPSLSFANIGSTSPIPSMNTANCTAAANLISPCEFGYSQVQELPDTHHCGRESPDTILMM